MNIFQDTSRIEHGPEGIRFYEQDILPCIYRFSSTIVIRTEIDYMKPGFGLFIASADSFSIEDSKHKYLVKLGEETFEAYYRDPMIQKKLMYDSSSLKADDSQRRIALRWVIKKEKVSVFLDRDKNGRIVNKLLGELKFSTTLNNYYFGIYSNKNNLLRNVSILSYVPDSWTTSIDNTRGGRIFFEKNSVTFENCVHDAEIEQGKIKLSPGKYWLTYDKERVNSIYDIDTFLYPDVEIDKENEETIEDEYKNILADDNSFTLTKETTILLKFRGTNGKVKNISIDTEPNATYIETEEEIGRSEGSTIKVSKLGASKIWWEAYIQKTPLFNDILKRCPYAVIEIGLYRYSLEELNLQVKTRYQFEYNIATNILTIVESKTGEQVYKGELKNKTEKNFEIFKNMSTIVYSLKTTTEDDEEIDLVRQKTFKKYMSNSGDGPIIVTDTKEQSFDLSASYREIVKPNNTKFACFRSVDEILVPEELPISQSNIKVYGIPHGVNINIDGKSITEVCDRYQEIVPRYIRRDRKVIKIEENILNLFEHIVLEYQSIEDFTYQFTNYERERFSGELTLLELEKKPKKDNRDIILYGIKKGSYTNLDYFYRVLAGDVSNIDYYAEEYDEIPGTEYTIDYENNTIAIKETSLYKNMYSEYVIDYLKENSYAINKVKRLKEYEVDISTSEKEIYIFSDQHNSDNVHKYIRTNIMPYKNKYIVLRHKRYITGGEHVNYGDPLFGYDNTNEAINGYDIGWWKS